MDLKKFKIAAARKQEKLTRFLKQLEELVPDDMQEIVADADAAMWRETDCTTCANCCKTMSPTFSKEDVMRIAAHVGMTPKAFRDKWLYKDETGDWMNKQQPCQFLVDNKCSIYEVRPVDCAQFPHHNLVPFDVYGDTYAANIMHCPATLTLVDKVRKKVEREYEWPK
ncbi:YkgJ family cysteine cluster protein [Nemorincola caseinilytica]|uniref:YkgJ family cysteine cluster protein n=1 Tax=Nemorincola caseinilytica TaxID=2054315 RepID=A0ABP8NE99_9BACT